MFYEKPLPDTAIYYLFVNLFRVCVLTQRVRKIFGFNLSSTATDSLSVIAIFGEGTKPNSLTYFE